MAQLSLPSDSEGEKGFGFGMEYVLIQQAKLGGQIDTSRGRSFPAEDAEVIAAAVSRLPLREAFLVFNVARTGLEPDWMPGATPKIEPRAWTRNGKTYERMGKAEKCGLWIETIVKPHPRNHRKKVRQKVRHDIMWTPITWTLHPDTILSARIEYQLWVRALWRLRDDLKRLGLRQFYVTDQLPRLAPWESPKAGIRRGSAIPSSAPRKGAARGCQGLRTPISLAS